MSEGGVFPWKRQKIVTPPVADYGSLSEPLPAPPRGSVWRRDPETREWQLVVSSQNNSNDGNSNTSITNNNINNNSKQGVNKKHNDTGTDSSAVDNTVEYVEHTVLPTDTLEGICLKYKVSSRALKRANGNFSGSYLLLAPKKLFIPVSKQKSGSIRKQNTDSEYYKRHSFLAEFPHLSSSEANCYLELADWVLEDAIHAARDDRDWEQKQQRNQQRLSSSLLPSKHVENRSNFINDIHSTLACPLQQQQRQERNQQRLPLPLSSTSSSPLHNDMGDRRSNADDDIHSNLTRPLLAECSMKKIV